MSDSTDRRIEKVETGKDTEIDDDQVPDNLDIAIIAARGGGAPVALAAAKAVPRNLAARIRDARRREYNPSPAERAADDERVDRRIAAESGRSYVRPPEPDDPPPREPRPRPDLPGQAAIAVERKPTTLSDRDATRLAEAELRRRIEGLRDHNPSEEYRKGR